MAVLTDDKKLNGRGLRVLWNLIKGIIPSNTSDLTNDSNFVADASYVHTDNNYTTEEKTKLGGIGAGAQANVIETIKVNNVDVTVTNKSVNIPVPTDNASLANGAGYQTATDVNNAIDSKMQAYIKPKGSLLFANLPTPSSSNLGWMWNMSDAFTIDNRFVEYESGVTNTYPKGTNVYVVEATPAVDETPATYLFDVYSGLIDLSGYATQEDVETLSQAEIESICS